MEAFGSGRGEQGRSRCGAGAPDGRDSAPGLPGAGEAGEREAPGPEAAFDRKVPPQVKAVLGASLLAVVLFSFFAGIYSIAEGYSPGQMAHAAGEHMAAYFYLWGKFLANPIGMQAPGAEAGGAGAVAAFFGNLWQALSGADVNALVTDAKLDRALFSIRLPRIALVLMVGAALSVAGGSFQGMFKNPLVSPDLLGASAGASLGACLAMLADAPNLGIQLGAFAGGLAAVGLTVWMRRYIKSDAVLGLVLAGMLVSTLFQSGMSFVKLVADTNDKLPAITYWLMGSFHGAGKADFWLALLPMLVGFALLMTQRWNLNVLSFGDDEARSMGVNTARTRLVVIVGATLITSTSVAVAGIVGWVGLVIPHFARAVVGPDYRTLLPACVLMGAGYLLVIDDIARMLISVEIPIGILTSILGVPFFLVIFRRTNRGW